MLELRDITKRFGDVLANDHINIVVEPGTIHAIVGENGAGKSTAMRIAYGFYTADSGEIVVDGEPRNIQTPHDAIRLGVGMVHQHFMLVDTMTVAENIVLGAEPGTPASIDLRKAADEIRALSDEFRLSVDPNALVHDLSVGQQQRVELLKALYRRARLLILDEPTAVLTPQEVEEFFAILRRMREQGQTVIIVPASLIGGAVEFEGRDITRASARERYELGIAHVPEDRHRRGLLLDFDLAENSILGVHYRRPAVSFSPFLDLKGIRERALEVI